jgi:hypothetical protein
MALLSAPTSSRFALQAHLSPPEMFPEISSVKSQPSLTLKRSPPSLSLSLSLSLFLPLIWVYYINPKIWIYKEMQTRVGSTDRSDLYLPRNGKYRKISTFFSLRASSLTNCAGQYSLFLPTKLSRDRAVLGHCRRETQR